MTQRIIHIPSSSNNHPDLTGRDAADQHPIDSITGLQPALDAKEDDLGNPIEDGQFLSSTIAGVRSWTTVESGKLTYNVTQVTHGFALDNTIALPGASYVLANATDGTKVSVGIVTEVVDADNFKFQDTGLLPYTAAVLVPGDTYWLSTIDGGITNVKASNYIQPLFKATKVDEALVNVEPMVIYGGSSGTSPGGGGGQLAINEVLVATYGDDGTGAIGDITKPFATPTAAAIAIRAVSLVDAVMIVQSGEFISEDILFEGVITCASGVVLLDGATPMFKNDVGTHDNVHFKIIGDAVINASNAAADMLTPVAELTLDVNIIGSIDDAILAKTITIKANRISFGWFKCHQLNYDVVEAGGLITTHMLNNVSTTGNHIINIGKLYAANTPIWFGISSENEQPVIATITIKEYFNTSGSSFSSLHLYGGTTDVEFNLDIKKAEVDFPIRIIDAVTEVSSFKIAGNIIADGIISNPAISLEGVHAGSKIKFNGLELSHLSNGEVVISDGLVTVDISASLSMITTASPKVDTDITLNNIIDIP